MPRTLDLAGQTFGRLHVVRKLSRDEDQHRDVRWICVCKCGQIVRVSTDKLRSGNTTSCGCQRTDTIKERCSTHGLSNSPEYIIWTAMKRRCHAPTHKDYPDYGGRGITVCREWRKSFTAFYQDMGPRPSPEHSIDRIKNNKGYRPDNCRWTTAKVQARNRTSTRYVLYKGKKMSLMEVAEETGLGYDRLKYRLTLNLSIDQVIAELRNPNRPRYQWRKKP